MITMILQMTGATLLYVLATAVLWRFWHKKAEHSLLWKLAIGLFYGLCSVISNHIGINYDAMVLNVRDIGPLAAGLFFSPVSGVVSGLIGGVERYLIGEFLDIGYFTRLACGLSTCLAGLLSAVLHKWIYEGERPSIVHSFFLGTLTEVFHMYAVLLTHREEMAMANYVVQICALPMILFTGLGLAACSVVVLRLSGKQRIISPATPRKHTPIHIQFQRWLLVVTVLLFGVSMFVNYSFQTRTAFQSARLDLNTNLSDYASRYEKNRDLDVLKASMTEPLMNAYIIYIIADADQKVTLGTSFDTLSDGTDLTGPSPINEEDLSMIVSHADQEVFTSVLHMLYDMTFICKSTKLDGSLYMLFCINTDTVYGNRDTLMYENLFLEIILFTFLYLLISELVEKLVVRNLDSVNRSLARITDGHLEEVVSVESSSEFTELSQDINETVAALRGYIDAAEKRMEEDLRLATVIQESALPRAFRFPRRDFEIYALMNPAKEVGGDFYDFFFIDMNQMALVIADVSGKSVPAALFMMRSKTAIKNYARSGNSPAELLANVNSVLCEGNDAEMFVTVWIGIIDLRTGKMRCANAGHEYPILGRAGENYAIYRDKHSLPLATIENIKMREYELDLNPGDQIFVYTDGIPEAINESQEAYGTDRLVTKLNAIRHESQQIKLESVLQDIQAFAGAADQFDDITMIGFTYNGPDFTEGPEPSSPEEASVPDLSALS